jgi:hypothetical protein
MTFISTAGHGYLKITINQLKKALLKGYVPTTYSMMNKSNALLEEDVDAGEFARIMKIDWKNITQKHQDNINKNLYDTIATNLEELEEYKNKIEMFKNSKIGDKLISYSGQEFTSYGTFQKKSLIVTDLNGKMWALKFSNVDKIIERKAA